MTEELSSGFVIKVIDPQKNISRYFLSVELNGIMNVTRHRALAFTLFSKRLTGEVVNILSKNHTSYEIIPEITTREEILHNAEFFRTLPCKESVNFQEVDA